MASSVHRPLSPDGSADRADALAAAIRADQVVRVTGARRSFAGRIVLDDVDLAMHRGEFVALLGRSGSGKSTLLRAMAGLDRDIEGSVVVPEARAVVFQDARLVPWKRVLPNVLLGLDARRERARAIALLEEVGLADHLRAWPTTLSGGEAQRVALARALARTPDLLLLDEPFGALDALTRIKMHELLRNLFQRYRPAVLFVTHDVDEAITLADRCLVLTDGRISFDERVEIDGERDRTRPAFERLRRALLCELGVDVDTGRRSLPDRS